jgi:hypothetical protein
MAAEPNKPEICTGYFTYGPNGEYRPCLIFQQKVFNPPVHYTELDPFIRAGYRGALSARCVESHATWNEKGESIERHLVNPRTRYKVGTIYNKLTDGPFGTGGKELHFPEPLLDDPTPGERDRRENGGNNRLFL